MLLSADIYTEMKAFRLETFHSLVHAGCLTDSVDMRRSTLGSTFEQPRPKLLPWPVGRGGCSLKCWGRMHEQGLR